MGASVKRRSSPKQKMDPLLSGNRRAGDRAVYKRPVGQRPRRRSHNNPRQAESPVHHGMRSRSTIQHNPRALHLHIIQLHTPVQKQQHGHTRRPLQTRAIPCRQRLLDDSRQLASRSRIPFRTTKEPEQPKSHSQQDADNGAVQLLTKERPGGVKSRKIEQKKPQVMENKKITLSLQRFSQKAIDRTNQERWQSGRMRRS